MDHTFFTVCVRHCTERNTHVGKVLFKKDTSDMCFSISDMHVLEITTSPMFLALHTGYASYDFLHLPRLFFQVELHTKSEQ